MHHLNEASFGFATMSRPGREFPVSCSRLRYVIPFLRLSQFQIGRIRLPLGCERAQHTVTARDEPQSSAADRGRGLQGAFSAPFRPV